MWIRLRWRRCMRAGRIEGITQKSIWVPDQELKNCGYLPVSQLCIWILPSSSQHSDHTAILKCLQHGSQEVGLLGWGSWCLGIHCFHRSLAPAPHWAIGCYHPCIFSCNEAVPQSIGKTADGQLLKACSYYWWLVLFQKVIAGLETTAMTTKPLVSSSPDSNQFSVCASFWQLILAPNMWVFLTLT